MASWKMAEPLCRRTVAHVVRARAAPFSTSQTGIANAHFLAGGSSASSGRRPLRSAVWAQELQMRRGKGQVSVFVPVAESRRCTGSVPDVPEGNASAATSPLTIGLGLAAAAAAAGCIFYFAGDEPLKKSDFELPPMLEETFEWADNLVVFMLDNPADLQSRHDELQHVVKTLKAQPSLHRCSFFFNAKKEDQQNLPDMSAQAAEADSSPVATGDAGPAAAAVPTLRVAMYKGQRKGMKRLSTAMEQEQIDVVTEFFAPVSEDLKESLRKLEVGRVSGLTFETDVLGASSPDAPILLQMYEDTCFLCFLMRPFINSTAELLREAGIPLRIKRMNLERNDFPDGCPVARGTPTFAFFRGREHPPVKWEEFKPKEVVDKLKTEFPNIPDDVFAQLDDMQNRVSNRLQLFSQTVMWTVELQKLERLISSTTPQAQSGSDADHPTEDAAFGTVVHEMMMKDMKRHDGLKSNLEYLRKEVEELEHDASLMGTMLAQSVLDREKAEGLIQYA